MEIKVIQYGRIDQGSSHRLSVIAWLLAELASKGQTVQLLHPSHVTARELEAALDESVLAAYDFSFANVTEDCIVVIDGDVIDDRTVERLKYLRKDVVLLIPEGALPPYQPGTSIDSLLERATHVPPLGDDEDQPKTFACRHNGPTCRSCASMVMQWKSDRRARALVQAG